MAERTASLLIVTREMQGDRRYGIGRSLMPMVEALQQRGWRVRYLCREDLPDVAKRRYQAWVDRLCRWPGIRGRATRQQLVTALLERLHMGWFAGQVAQAERFSVVHLHDPWLAFGFRVASMVWRRSAVRWGVTEHGFGSYSRATHEDGLSQGVKAQRWLRRLESWVLSQADFVTAPTQLALNQLSRDLGLAFNAANWHVVPHAVPSRNTWTREQARMQLGWDAEDFVVLGVGRLVPLKRFDLLLDACARLVPVCQRLRVVVLGDGDSRALDARAATAGLAGRLHCMAVDDVWPYYAASDIYVSTSTTESFGLASFEAMCAGLPCICTAVGGVPEVMGTGAWLVPVEGGAVFAALQALVGDPVQRLDWALRARAQAAQARELDAVVDQYVALYSA